MSNYILTSNGELYHYGIKGQKWGVRRAQKKAALRDKLARKLKQEANDNFKASKIMKGLADEDKGNIYEDRETYNSQIKGLSDAGNRYMKSHKKLMSMDINSVSKRQIKKEYWNAYRDATKLNFGLDVFDLVNNR